MTPTFDSRYLAVRPLGRGAEGSVWLARDGEVADRVVAIKTLRSEAGRADGLRHEFSLLRGLRHPGLARVHDLRVDASGAPFLVMERVEGAALDAWWPTVTQGEVLDAFASLLSALDFIHRRGVVHRDVKPANVLAGGAGVKLVDFGLAVTLEDAAQTSGTLAYLAPEIVGGGAPSPASDLYSVGVMLHQFLFGALPACAARGAAREEVASPPADEIPEALCRLVAHLLAPEPSLRPASGAEALALLAGASGAAPYTPAEVLVGQGLPEPALVGRDQELAALGQLLEDASRGRGAPGGVFITSGRGLGRSRLCAEAADLARLCGYSVLSADRLVSLSRGAEAPRSHTEPVAEGAAAVARLVQTVLDQPVPCFLLADDLDTGLVAQAILALGRQPPAPLFICAAAPSGHPLEAELTAVLQPMRLPALTPSSTARLIQSVLPSGWSTPALARRVHALSGGHPGQCVGLLRAAVRELLARRGDAALAESVERAAQNPALIDGARLRLCGLSEDERAAGGRLALFADGIHRARFCRLYADLPPSTLDSLLTQGVITEDVRDVLRVADQALAGALLAQLETRERRAAAALALADARAHQDPLLLRARLAIRGDRASDDPDLILQAARVARAERDLTASVELYTAALEALPPDHRERPAAIKALVDLHLALGQSAAAIALLQDSQCACTQDQRPALVAALADTLQRAGRGPEALSTLDQLPLTQRAQSPLLQLVTSRALMVLGRYDEAQEAALRAAALASVDVKANGASAPAGDAGDRRPSDTLSEGLYPAASPTQVAAEARYLVGLSAYYRGEMSSALEALDHAEAAARQGDDPLSRARIENARAMVHHRLSAFPEATACYERALTLARHGGHLPQEATLLMNLGGVCQQQGDLASALDHYQGSLRVASSFGGRREMAQVLHNLGRLYLHCGHAARAEGCLEQSLSLCQAMGWSSLTAYDLLVAGEVAVEAGRLDEAEEKLGGAAALFARIKDARGEAEVGLARGRLLLAKGALEDAWALVEGIGELAADMDSVVLRARCLRGTLALEGAGGEGDRALYHLRAALRLAEDSAEHEPLAEIHALLARACDRAGEVAQAEAHRASARQLLLHQLQALPPELHAAFSSVPFRQDLLARPAGAADGLAPSPGRGRGTARHGRRAAAVLDAELLATLLEINKELNAEPDLKRLLERIIDHAVELAGAERGFLIMDRKPKMAIEVARNIDQETIRNKTFKISRSIADEVLSTGKPVLAVDAMDDQRFEAFLSVHHLKLRSIVCVPLAVRRQVRGAIYLDNRFQAEAFTDRHVALLGALADQAGLAVGHWELLEQNRERQEELARHQDELRALNARLKEAMEQQSSRLEELRELTEAQRGELTHRYRFDNLVGQSAPMREMFRLMERVKDSDAPVMIQGESGTGKELVARALHFSGHRKAGAFVAVNCGAIPGTLLESELFGHAKGAFTGAHKAHQGLLQRADGGTLFLDEVGEMPLELQVKLLRVLQDKRFTRLGGEGEQASDFRVIAATNKDLSRLAAEGRFREDLLFRLHVIRLDPPPLRQRREDIPALIGFLLDKHGGSAHRVSRAALRLLMDYPWPGNVRELENEIQRVIALAGPSVGPEDLSARIRAATEAPTPAIGWPASLSLKEAMERFERQVVVQALEACQGSVKAAAERLGLTRVGLHKLLRRQGIDRFGRPVADQADEG